MENSEGTPLRVKVGSLAFLTAAGTGYGIGLVTPGGGSSSLVTGGPWRI